MFRIPIVFMSGLLATCLYSSDPLADGVCEAGDLAEAVLALASTRLAIAERPPSDRSETGNEGTLRKVIAGAMILLENQLGQRGN